MPEDLQQQLLGELQRAVGRGVVDEDDLVDVTGRNRGDGLPQRVAAACRAGITTTTFEALVGSRSSNGSSCQVPLARSCIGSEDELRGSQGGW
ncbi:MAG: hypothetical protein U0R26_10695 [Solirubrobacterales bacterium]